MYAALYGFFSGFPTHHFTDEIADILSKEITVRENLVFISAWPHNYKQNDDDSDGMHEMFAERGMGFSRHFVIDERMSGEDALKLISEASCVFLMGGNATEQMRMIKEKGLVNAIRTFRGVILGVSAGSMNMGKYAVDIWESVIPYEGLGLAAYTVKAHYSEGEEFVGTLKEVSTRLPVTAMEDESAIFVKSTGTEYLGRIYRIDKGRINRIVIETERLFLREMDMGDFDALYAVLADPEIMRHYPYTFDEKRVREWIERNMKRYRENGFGLWAICLKDTGEMIGDCGLTIQNINGEMLPEIGYHVRKDCQRRGYAREAARAVRDWAFRNTDYPALYSYCKYTNEASYKTAESIGMRFEKEYPEKENGITHVSVIRRCEL